MSASQDEALAALVADKVPSALERCLQEVGFGAMQQQLASVADALKYLMDQDHANNRSVRGRVAGSKEAWAPTPTASSASAATGTTGAGTGTMPEYLTVDDEEDPLPVGAIQARAGSAAISAATANASASRPATSTLTLGKRAAESAEPSVDSTATPAGGAAAAAGVTQADEMASPPPVTKAQRTSDLATAVASAASLQQQMEAFKMAKEQLIAAEQAQEAERGDQTFDQARNWTYFITRSLHYRVDQLQAALSGLAEFQQGWTHSEFGNNSPMERVFRALLRRVYRIKDSLLTKYASGVLRTLIATTTDAPEQQQALLMEWQAVEDLLMAIQEAVRGELQDFFRADPNSDFIARQVYALARTNGYQAGPPTTALTCALAKLTSEDLEGKLAACHTRKELWTTMCDALDVARKAGMDQREAVHKFLNPPGGRRYNGAPSQSGAGFGEAGIQQSAASIAMIAPFAMQAQGMALPPPPPPPIHLQPSLQQYSAGSFGTPPTAVFWGRPSGQFSQPPLGRPFRPRGRRPTGGRGTGMAGGPGPQNGFGGGAHGPRGQGANGRGFGSANY